MIMKGTSTRAHSHLESSSIAKSLANFSSSRYSGHVLEKEGTRFGSLITSKRTHRAMRCFYVCMPSRVFNERRWQGSLRAYWFALVCQSSNPAIRRSPRLIMAGGVTPQTEVHMPSSTRASKKSKNVNASKSSLELVSSNPSGDHSRAIVRAKLIPVPDAKTSLDPSLLTGALLRLVNAYTAMDSKSKRTLLDLAERYAANWPANTPVELGLVDRSGVVKRYSTPTIDTTKVEKTESRPVTASGEPLSLYWETPREAEILSRLREGRIDEAIRLVRGERKPGLAVVSSFLAAKRKSFGAEAALAGSRRGQTSARAKNERGFA